MGYKHSKPSGRIQTKTILKLAKRLKNDGIKAVLIQPQMKRLKVIPVR